MAKGGAKFENKWSTNEIKSVFTCSENTLKFKNFILWTPPTFFWVVFLFQGVFIFRTVSFFRSFTLLGLSLFLRLPSFWVHLHFWGCLKSSIFVVNKGTASKIQVYWWCKILSKYFVWHLTKCIHITSYKRLHIVGSFIKLRIRNLKADVMISKIFLGLPQS